MPIEFTKYHGLGNDFILVDNRHSSEPVVNTRTSCGPRAIDILALAQTA